MSDANIEKVARAFCIADGKQPDEEIQTSKRITKRSGNTVSSGYEVIPQWKAYLDEATRFVAAHDALTA